DRHVGSRRPQVVYFAYGVEGVQQPRGRPGWHCAKRTWFYCLGRVIRSRRLFCRRVSVGSYVWPEWYGIGSRRLLHDKVLLSLYFGSRPRIKGKLGGKRLRYSLAAPHDRCKCKGNYRGKYWFV